MTGEYYLGVGNSKEVDFYIIKGIAEEILDYLGYKNRYSFVADEKKIAKEFHPGVSAVISVNNDIMGVIGKVHPKVCEDKVYALEINLDKLLAKQVGKMKFKEISKFPKIKKDLAIVVDKNITSKEIETVIKKSAGKLLQEIKVFDVYEGKNLLDLSKKSIAYSLTFGDKERTLHDEEINEIMDKIIKVLEKAGMELRK